MKIQVIRKCTNCFFHYCRDLEDDVCFEDGGCNGFSPIGLKREDVEVIEDIEDINPCFMLHSMI